MNEFNSFMVSELLYFSLLLLIDGKSLIGHIYPGFPGHMNRSPVKLLVVPLASEDERSLGRSSRLQQYLSSFVPSWKYLSS